MQLNLLPASLTVTELTQYLRQVLESDPLLQDAWVQGEVSNLARPSSGHIYFTLKDQTAALKCVIWRSAAQRIRLALQNGLEVEAHGAINIYERDGQYQLYVTALRPVGEGQLYQQFLRLKADLEAEGLFDDVLKRPIPPFPGSIGIVTSLTGAALQDILNTLRQRYPLAEVILAPSAVQGAEAPIEIAGALDLLNRSRLPDVIILARGGGSLEDLWAFNDERVVRAIRASRIPVISGVGHETDFTLADFAADLRAPTPTAAAVAAAPDIADLKMDLSGGGERLLGAFVASLKRRRESLRNQRLRLRRASPLRRILDSRQRIDELEVDVQRAFSHAVRLRRAALVASQLRLHSLDPRAVLRRGYAIVRRRDDRRLVGSTRQVQPGDALMITVVDGNFEAQVAGESADLLGEG
ncbi:MAG TPA: exodeoxyribonuclease VII large subunit [Levilinea sp.]|nr:exodeoxyribonuclease VII large subunit [Levilinea sp.]